MRRTRTRQDGRTRGRPPARGMALTELALVAPLFIAIIMWSQFFVDLGIMKLKLLEATRYVLWELVAQQPPDRIRADVERRFRDLASPATMDATRPQDSQSMVSVRVARVTMNDRLPARLDGRIPRQTGGGGFIANIMATLNNFLSRTADWVIQRYRFNQNGAAEATVRFEAQHGFLLATGEVVGTFFRPDSALVPPTIAMELKSPRMLVDVWKAWPGKYNADAGNGNIETAPSATYPTGGASGAPERIVARRVANAAFFGFGNGISSVTRYLTYVGLPNPINMDTWRGDRNRRDADGPIMMAPGAPARNSFTPGYGSGLQRYGDSRYNATGPVLIRDPSSNNIDRARYTTPSRISSGLWTSFDGGARPVRSNVSMRNPYVAMYSCRDAFYMGSRRNEVSRYRARSVREYQTRAFPGCNREGY